MSSIFRSPTRQVRTRRRLRVGRRVLLYRTAIFILTARVSTNAPRLISQFTWKTPERGRRGGARGAGGARAVPPPPPAGRVVAVN
ncbi:hypothetical protein EVAR_28132_1 [Eumeta japonica]|uniref:Uncharacterized protein n=1 Tax=Eumeta variegata TaxID=151549 RepID=A0A4C1VD66_EUMVA|nr:hypothetical protein EVAR_28132_1 [Eumeta japonica]